MFASPSAVTSRTVARVAGASRTSMYELAASRPPLDAEDCSLSLQGTGQYVSVSESRRPSRQSG